MSTDTHDKLIRAMLEYCTTQDKFEFKGGDDAGVRARVALGEIKRLAKLRREEIQAKREHRRKLRNGREGRPRKVISSDETY
jgi:uncharacterized protein YggL (DUF469 family)